MKYEFVIIMILSISLNALAQRRGISGISYNMGYTAEDTRDFADDYSWRGFGIEYKRFTSKQISVGFQTGWNICDGRKR